MNPLRTDSTATVDEKIEVAQPSPYCDCCPHPEAAHDATASRYCAATLKSVLSRGCICRW